MEYLDIIKHQRALLSKDSVRKFWPLCLYHFTDVHNAASILKDGMIYSRDYSVSHHIMVNDNASSAVIRATNSTVKGYGRLYFRPKTPTQYHNEGYKPPTIRSLPDANCPVPIFICLGANEILNLPGTKFAEKGMAGAGNEIREGVEAFSQLQFDKIYHDGVYDRNRDGDIKSFRHSEVIREGGFPVNEPFLKAIVCRSIAEKDMLLYLLRTNSPDKYEEYKEKIYYRPKLSYFYNNGIFVRNVRVDKNNIIFELNDSLERFNSVPASINVTIHIQLFSKDRIIVEDNMLSTTIDYSKYENLHVEYNLQNLDFDMLKIMLRFDDSVMYENVINVSNAILF